MRILAALLAVLAVAGSAAAAGDVPDSSKPDYFIVRARFVPKEVLLNPQGPDPYIGVKVKGDVEVRGVLAGKPAAMRFSSNLWLPKMAVPLDVYLLVETEPEGAPEIAAWSLTRLGFCILPEQALDGPVDDIARLRSLYPCKWRPR